MGAVADNVERHGEKSSIVPQTINDDLRESLKVKAYDGWSSYGIETWSFIILRTNVNDGSLVRRISSHDDGSTVRRISFSDDDGSQDDVLVVKTNVSSSLVVCQEEEEEEVMYMLFVNPYFLL